MTAAMFMSHSRYCNAEIMAPALTKTLTKMSHDIINEFEQLILGEAVLPSGGYHLMGFAVPQCKAVGLPAA